MTKFSNKYRIESNRLPGWDYGGNGMYFITIVTKDRNCLFGKIKNYIKTNPLTWINDKFYYEHINY